MGELLAAAAVTLVTAVFSVSVLRQWLRRGRPYQAAWLAALTMATIAAGSYVLFLLLGRPAVLFRLYYLFGAALNVAYLGLGSLYLTWRRSLGSLVIVLLAASIVTASAVFAAPVNAAQLAVTSGAGTQVLGAGPWLPLLILMNTFGTVCLVGTALYSAWRTWQRGGAIDRAAANVVIAAGALTIAGAGTLARFTGAGGFWLTMLVGWIIMYAGFVLANRAHAPVKAPTPASQLAANAPQARA